MPYNRIVDPVAGKLYGKVDFVGRALNGMTIVPKTVVPACSFNEMIKKIVGKSGVFFYDPDPATSDSHMRKMKSGIHS